MHINPATQGGIFISLVLKDEHPSRTIRKVPGQNAFHF
jgi:hypothetical protein